MDSTILRIVFVVLITAACSPSPQIDVGTPLVRGQHADWVGWSPNASTLYWVGPDSDTASTSSLKAIDVATRSVMPLVLDIISPPQFSDDGSVGIYIVADSNSSGVLAKAAFAGLTSGPAIPIATDAGRFVISPDGRYAAVQDASWNLSIIDTATTSSVNVGRGDPIALSPDGTDLVFLGLVPDFSTGSQTFVVDFSTGAQTALVLPDGAVPRYVARWDGNEPRLIVTNQGTVVDLVAGTSMSLGTGVTETTSGGLAAPSYIYLWDAHCIDQYVDGTETVCDESQYLLHRVNIVTGVGDYVASAIHQYDIIAVSEDGRYLAMFVDPITTTADDTIEVKRLPDPP